MYQRKIGVPYVKKRVAHAKIAFWNIKTFLTNTRMDLEVTKSLAKYFIFRTKTWKLEEKQTARLVEMKM